MTALTFYFVVFLLYSCSALEIIPERAGVVYENPKYVKGLVFNVRRYSRKTPYVMNASGTALQTWADNVTVNIVFYEYLHNEYRRSFVEMNFKLCYLMNKDPLLSPAAKMTGLPCPVPKGFLNLNNMTLLSAPAVDQLPYKWPFEKGKVEIMFKTFPKKELMAEMYLIATFKQPLVIKKKL